MLGLKYFFSCTIIIAIANSATLFREDLIVQTTNGQVQGRESSTIELGQSFYSFRGIPFAEAPIGELRFEPPVPKSNWDGIWDATEDRAHCVQGADPVMGEEDCLFINVYTPTKPSASCEPLPTMVWIYGGGFEGGDSTYDLYGPDYLLEKNVVVVSFNYRLGLLGFLSTGDTVAPGNNGLKDQLLALQWVRDNVRNFCGNPDDITLAGQSAGSASVAYHIQSPKSQGLFHRAIMQSGVSLSLWGLSRRVPEIVDLVAQDLGVDNSTSKSIVDGLKTFNTTYLQTKASATITSAYLANNPREGFAVGPVVEPNHPDAFFTGKSHEIMSSGEFAKVPILMGFNSLEGTYNFELLFRLYLVQYDLNPVKLLPIDMNVDSSVASAAAKKLKSYYFGWIPVSMSNMELMRFLSDDQFVRSIREFARLAQKHVPVYMYRFSYEGGLWGYHNRTIAGVTHSEELGYYWRSKHDPASDHDLVIRSRMVALWTNFIKHGNPTPTNDPILQNTIWSPLGNDLTYLDIGEHLVLTKSPEKDNMAFWDDFYAEYGNPPYGTY
ncbi:hypothetical protein GEV33_002811 [Tenebrio molitor]|uniref:Carboxylesterase type B domain-containing protein n=1 Tax=Tenebrio molitor TaxID=7067 RepID=A0A8J6HSQ1_TENMO|nr:hypothetical protein GEV33_002811 [Tenebrio molitor]